MFRALVFRVHLYGQFAEVPELDLGALETDRGGGGGMFVRFGDEKINGFGGEAGGLDAIERGGVAALLQMSEDRLAHLKELFSFFGEEGANEIAVINWVGVFITDD